MATTLPVRSAEIREEVAPTWTGDQHQIAPQQHEASTCQEKLNRPDTIPKQCRRIKNNGQKTNRVINKLQHNTNEQDPTEK